MSLIIFLATFMKKSLKISDTFLGSFTMSLFSLKVIELFVFTPLLDKKGFIVGRQEIYKKCTLHNKFLKQKTNKNWEAYRKQRNFVNKLKKKSVHKYFYERCAGGPKSSDFWPTIVFIACILGWFSSITVFGFPIFLATFMKKSLKISDTLLGFYERCAGGPKSSDFWPTIKPFFFI
jgi:hypothetical protein